MTGDASRSEQALSVFLSILMVGSVIAIGGAAFAGSAAAQTADNAGTPADLTVGQEATSHDLANTNLSFSSTGDNVTIAVDVSGLEDSETEASLSNAAVGNVETGSGDVVTAELIQVNSSNEGDFNDFADGDQFIRLDVNNTGSPSAFDVGTLELTGINTTGVTTGSVTYGDVYLHNDQDLSSGPEGTATGNSFNLVGADSITVTENNGNSIQYAVNNVAEDGTVSVEPGTYNESVDIAQNVTLESTDGASVTTIDTQGTDSGVEFTPSASGATIDGFTLTNASSELVFGRSGVEDITVSNNVISDEDSIGVYFTTATSATIKGNTIENITGTNPGIGINTDKSATIENNTVSDMESYYGIEIFGDIDVDVENNTLSGTDGLYADSTGGGVEIHNNNLLDGITNDGEEINATNNWWGATNGPSGDFDGNGTSVTGSVTVDPASVNLDSGSIDLDQDFIGTVNDPQNVTLNGSSDAEFSFDADVPGEVDGTLVLDIGGTEFVFKDVLDGGEINTTIGPDDADDSGKNGTSIAVSEGNGDRNVSVAGNDTAAVEQAGTTKLIHVAKAAPNTGYFVTSMPQSGEFHEQGIGDVTQYDGNADTNEEEYSSFDTSNDVASVNRALFINAESASARYGYTFDTDRSDQQTDFGSVRLSTGWHVLGSNYNVSQSDEVEIQNDLQTQTAVGTSDLNVYPSTNPDGTGSFESDTKVSEYEAYYVYVHSEDNRPVFLPEYDPTADKNGGE